MDPDDRPIKGVNPDERPIKGSDSYNIDFYEYAIEENYSEKETATSDSCQLKAIVDQYNSLLD